MENFLFKAETFKIIGICMEVHRELGFGFAEIVYKDAVEIEALTQKISTEREKSFCIYYKERMLPHKFLADFVMFDKIIVEIKASSSGLIDEHIAQTLNYIKAAHVNIGLLVNFGRKSLEYKRLIF